MLNVTFLFWHWVFLGQLPSFSTSALPLMALTPSVSLSLEYTGPHSQTHPARLLPLPLLSLSCLAGKSLSARLVGDTGREDTNFLCSESFPNHLRFLWPHPHHFFPITSLDKKIAVLFFLGFTPRKLNFGDAMSLFSWLFHKPSSSLSLLYLLFNACALFLSGLSSWLFCSGIPDCHHCQEILKTNWVF